MHLPGVHPELDLSRIGKAERQIVNALSNVWFITFVRAAMFKRSDYTFAFAKPTDELINNFHLDREIMVLFSPYSEFQPRALDFVDKTVFEFQNRLDKLCVILVSQDVDIKNKIRNRTVQDRESRIIVPYNYGELSDATPESSRRIILDRLKEFFHQRDLFAFESPLRSDAYFFGRSKALQDLYSKYKSGGHAGLFGLRKIGKTSTLYALGRHMKLTEEPSVFLDCSETAFHRRRWHEALHFIVSNLASTLEISDGCKLNPPESYSEKEASQCFEEDLGSLHAHLGHKRLLIILDEIESITFDISPSDHWAKEKDFVFFWQSVRSVYQKNPEVFSLVIAGVNPKAVETPTVQGYDNPIYRLITPTYLGLFDFQEVREMVSYIGNYMGLQFEEEVFTYLTDDYGGHPFLIRQICSQIHKAVNQSRPYTVTKFRYQSDRVRMNRSVQDYIDLIVSVLRERYQVEYRLLEHLAQGDHDTFRKFADASPTLIEHLTGYGLVREDSGGYHFRIRAVESYIKEKTQVARTLTTLEEKWKEVTSLRNKVETSLRKVVKQALSLHFGPTKAREVFLDIVSPMDRKDRLSALSFDQILEAEVYLEDLRKIIIKKWAELGRLFANDRATFDTYMEFTNKHRIDAHAQDLSDDELSVLIIALRWLQRHIDDFL